MNTVVLSWILRCNETLAEILGNMKKLTMVESMATTALVLGNMPTTGSVLETMAALLLGNMEVFRSLLGIRKQF